MRQYKRFSGQHDDYVHDVAYDHYSKRLATCSSDHKIKVWSDTGSEWKLDAELEGHRGAVWKLAWAHPEFGQVIASCSLDQDQQVIIWEELDGLEGGGASSSGSKSAEKNTLNENQQHGNSANSVSTGGSSKDNLVEMYSRWHRVASLKAEGHVSVNDMKFAPRHFGLCLATCSSDGLVRVYMADDIMNLDSWTLSDKFVVKREDREEATSLSWNPSRFDSKMVVVGTTKGVRIWAKNASQRRWEAMVEFPMSGSGMNIGINDVCWAPNLGRSYHLIASATSNSVTVWRLNESNGSYSKVEKEDELLTSGEVWRVEWNITGTVLATSSDDGGISLWRRNFQNKWISVAKEEASN